MNKTIIQRANKLRLKAREKAKKEMQSVSATNWRGMTIDHERAVKIVHYAYDQTIQFIDSALKKINGNSEVQKACEVFATAQLDIVESVIERDTSVEIRIAQLQGYSTAMDEQRKNLEKIKGLAPTEITNGLQSFTGYAESASKFVKDLSQKALTYYDITVDLVNRRLLAQELNINFKSRLPTFQNSEKFINYLRNKGAKYEQFLKTKSFFSKATKFFGVLQIGFAITTVVYETLSKQGQWASSLAKAWVAAGSAVALSYLVTGALVTSIITGTLAAAGLTTECPPLAGVIIAAGIVIIAGIAIVSLFDTIVESIFGKEGIPRSMRLSMTTKMYTNMSASMSSQMATSMVSLPH